MEAGPTPQETEATGSATEPVGIFVYGTLRQDVPRQPAYSGTFHRGVRSVPARLENARLFFDGHHPFVQLQQAGLA
jgi:hypothetical protein